MRLSPLSLLLPALALSGCEEEVLKTLKTCRTNDAGYAVDKLSQLDVVHTMRLAHNHPAMKPVYGQYVGGIDALEIKSSKPKNAEGVWTVGSVEVLVAIPADEFDDYPSGKHKLGVVIYDSTDPSDATPYEVVQTLDPSKLDWEDTTVRLWDKDDEDTEPNADVKTAWWKFDFTDEIPADKGIKASTYVVGIHWFKDDAPLAGASEMEMDCGKNWYDFGDGNLRKGIDGKMTCTWPMLKVNTQLIVEKETCE